VRRPDARGRRRLRCGGPPPPPARPARAFTAPPASERTAQLRPQEAVAARSVQKELLSEIDRLTQLIEQARAAAARLVVAIGDDASLAQRVFSALSSRPRGGPRHRPAETDDQPPVRLN
jgi:hypothetical protein